MDALEGGGLSPQSIDAAFERIRKHDLDWRAGRCFTYVFSPGEDVGAVAKRAYMAFRTENALDPTSFPSLVRMENELVQIAAELTHGESAVGNFTSGGTREHSIGRQDRAGPRTRATRSRATRPCRPRLGPPRVSQGGPILRAGRHLRPGSQGLLCRPRSHGRHDRREHGLGSRLRAFVRPRRDRPDPRTGRSRSAAH